MKRKIVITLMIIGLLLIVSGAILKHLGVFGNENTINSINGIYQNNAVIIKIYKLNNDKLYFNINDSSLGIINCTGNEASGSVLDEDYSFTTNNNELTVVNNNYNGKYIKKSNYSSNDFYNDNYGNINYLNGNYNGIYNLNNTKIYLYQTNENEVRISILKDNDINDYFYQIRDDKSLYYRLGNEEHIITINKSNLIYKTVIDGTITENQFTKEKSLTIKDIINKLNIIKK